jgi:hypothetical protein
MRRPASRASSGLQHLKSNSSSSEERKVKDPINVPEIPRSESQTGPFDICHDKGVIFCAFNINWLHFGNLHGDLRHFGEMLSDSKSRLLSSSVFGCERAHALSVNNHAEPGLRYRMMDTEAECLRAHRR